MHFLWLQLNWHISGRSCHSIILVAAKVLLWQTHVCRQKISLMSPQKYACCNKTFVTTKLCLSWQNNFVTTFFFSWQTHFCCDKSFAVTSILLLVHMLVATKVNLQENYVCQNKYFLRQAYFCLNKDMFCYNKHVSKTFVETKMILMAMILANTRDSSHWLISKWFIHIYDIKLSTNSTQTSVTLVQRGSSYSTAGCKCHNKWAVHWHTNVMHHLWLHNIY